MERIPEIILALIEQTPWFAIMYVVNKAYQNKPKHMLMKYSDILSLETDR